MTVLFVGTERDALRDSGGGDSPFLEGTTAGYFNTTYARGYTTLSSGSGTYLDFPMQAASDEAWLHHSRRYYGFDDGSNQPLVQLMDASNNVLARLVQKSLQHYGLQYWNGSAFTDVGVTLSDPNPASVLHTFDLHVIRHATAGVVEFYYDDALVASATGLNTASYGTMTHGRMTYNGGGNTPSEVIVSDKSTVGAHLKTFVPQADGTDTGGTGTYANVNELPLDTAAFVGFTAAGERHSFTKAAQAFANTVPAVGIGARMRVADLTGPQHVKPYLLIGGVRYYGTTFALTTSFESYEYVWNTDPATGVAWTTANAGSATYMQFGWEAVA